MSSVVFLRGVNVGGKKVFQPSALARELSGVGAVNVGAAGTFVVRNAIGAAALQAELERRLPFEAEIMICPAREVLALASRDPFSGEPAGKEVKRYVTVLAKRPRTVPSLPLTRPAGRDWQVKVIAIPGRFALSLHRRLGRTLVYPNEVIEQALGISATTRNWSTISAICDILSNR